MLGWPGIRQFDLYIIAETARASFNGELSHIVILSHQALSHLFQDCLSKADPLNETSFAASQVLHSDSLSITQ